VSVAPQSRSHSRSRSRPRARAARPPTAMPTPGVPLAGPEEALRLILAAASRPPRHETIAVLLDGAHRGLGPCLVCDGASTADQVLDLGGLLGTLGEREPTVGAVVLATSRPGNGIELLPADEAAFYRLRHDLAELGVDLLDWFLLDAGLAASVSERTDGCWRWSTEPPSW
jgi:hypothetical protein